MKNAVHPPPTYKRFDDKLRAVEKQLSAKLEEIRANLNHAGSKGTSTEAAFRETLRNYLPRRFGVGQGEVIDTKGNVSKQCDVIIATDHHPNWYSPDDPTSFLIEGVAAVAEVKSVLTTQELDTTIEKVRAFRRLKPDWSGYTEVIGGRDSERWYESPPYFVFAYESDVTLETITKKLMAAVVPQRGREGQSVDGVFALNRGYVLDVGDGTGAFVLQGPDGSRLTGYWYDEDRALLTLMMWLPMVMTAPVTQMPVLAKYLLGDAARK